MAQVARKDGFDLEALRAAGQAGQSNTIMHPAQEDGGPEFAALRERIADLERAGQASVERDAAEAGGGQVTATVTRRRPRRTKAPPADDLGMRTSDARSTNEMSTSPTTQAAGANAPNFNDLLTVAKQLGEDAGKGKDTQIKFALKVIEAAYLNVIDLDPNKHGTDRRDGLVLAETYVRAQQGAVIFDAKADTGRKLISNLDKCIKLGSNPKWGQGEPLQNVNALMTFRQAEKRAGKKVDDAFNTLMRYATQQLKKDTLIADDELKAFVYKRQAQTRTAEDVLESVRKTLNQLKAGKIAHCSDMDTSSEVAEAIRCMTKRLTNIAKARGATTAPPAAAPKAA